MLSHRRHRLALFLGSTAFAGAALIDALLTLRGLNGDIALEANPLLRALMQQWGLPVGLLIGKGTVLIGLVLFAVLTVGGIERNAPWVYYLAFFPFSRAWMQRKKRYWIAFAPLYLTALAQLLAGLLWWFSFHG